MGAVGTTKNTKKKIGKKSKRATGTKLKIKLNKYSEDLKAKRKERVQQWKVSMVLFHPVKVVLRVFWFQFYMLVEVCTSILMHVTSLFVFFREVMFS